MKSVRGQQGVILGRALSARVAGGLVLAFTLAAAVSAAALAFHNVNPVSGRAPPELLPP